jgi:SAM-dependent methyltransferase
LLWETRRRRSATVRWLRDRLYGPHRSRYETLLEAQATSAGRILEFGAGRGAKELDLRGPGREVVGVDIDEAVLGNPFVDRAIVYDGHRLPFPDACFDMSCLQSVIEHLSDPATSFAELARVVRPGGRLLFKTPNKWFYAMVVSRLVPNRLHPRIIGFATGRREGDVFPTFYRANTRRRLRRLLSAAGFSEVELHVHLHGAGYLGFSLPTYLVGVLYERIVNVSPLLEGLRGHIVGHFIRAHAAPPVRANQDVTDLDISDLCGA